MKAVCAIHGEQEFTVLNKNFNSYCTACIKARQEKHSELINIQVKELLDKRRKFLNGMPYQEQTRAGGGENGDQTERLAYCKKR